MKYWISVILILLCIPELFSFPTAGQFHVGFDIRNFRDSINLNLGIHDDKYLIGLKYMYVTSSPDEVRSYMTEAGVLIGSVLKIYDNRFLTIAGGLSYIDQDYRYATAQKDKEVWGIPWMLQTNLPFSQTSPSTMGISFTISGNINDAKSYTAIFLGLCFVIQAE
jgi:hypothetical protein